MKIPQLKSFFKLIKKYCLFWKLVKKNQCVKFNSKVAEGDIKRVKSFKEKYLEQVQDERGRGLSVMYSTQGEPFVPRPVSVRPRSILVQPRGTFVLIFAIPNHKN